MWEIFPESPNSNQQHNNDGNKNNKIDDPNTTLNYGSGFPISKNFDNYYWKFTLEDKIDKTAPYLRSTKPGVSVGSVSTTEDIVAVFSKRMRVGSIYTIGITEHPAYKYPMWFRFEIDLPVSSTNHYTTSTIKHGDFITSVLGATYYYIPQITSAVEDVNFNCFYPGLGPGSNVVGSIQSTVCDGTSTNCNSVTSSTKSNLYCDSAIGVKGTDLYSATTCLKDLKDLIYISK